MKETTIKNGKIITHEPEVCEGYVWCDYEGAVHEDVEDPMFNGPQIPAAVEGEEGWEIREAGEEYSFQTLAFYVCPGQHLPVFTIRPV